MAIGNALFVRYITVLPPKIYIKRQGPVLMGKNNYDIRDAIAAHQSGDFIRAKQLYKDIIKTDFINCDAYHNLGLLYLSERKFDKAYENVQKAIEINELVPQFWLTMANVCVSLQRNDEFKAIVEKCVTLNFNADVILKVKKIFENENVTYLIDEFVSLYQKKKFEELIKLSNSLSSKILM